MAAGGAAAQLNRPLPPGFVPSTVFMGGRTEPDCNGFFTALAVRTLRMGAFPVADAMLDALEACRSPQGGFRFWPRECRPPWAPDLPDDTDDTALMTLELYLAGRLARHDARRIACRTIGTHRIRRLHWPGPTWRRAGVFKTWHREAAETDLIDCTATANAIALLAALDLKGIPGYAQACAMLADAVSWAGDSDVRAASLSPFYPDPAEFVLALEHAVACGAKEIEEVYLVAERTPWGCDPWTRVTRSDHAVCSSPYGFALWRSEVLARLRKLSAIRPRAFHCVQRPPVASGQVTTIFPSVSE